MKYVILVAALLFLGTFAWRSQSVSQSVQVQSQPGNPSRAAERNQAIEEKASDRPCKVESKHPIPTGTALPSPIDPVRHREWVAMRDDARKNRIGNRRRALPLLLNGSLGRKRKLLPDVVALSRDLNPTFTPLTSEQLRELRVLLESFRPTIDAACDAAAITTSDQMVELNQRGKLLDHIEQDAEFPVRMARLRDQNPEKHALVTSGKLTQPQVARALGYQRILVGCGDKTVDRYFPRDKLAEACKAADTRNFFVLEYCTSVIYWSYSVGLITPKQRDELVDRAVARLQR